MISQAEIINALPHAIQTVDFPHLGDKQNGKVRDFYIKDGKRIMFTTDRISAFDVVLGSIPYKGAVLNSLAAYWFEQTKNVIGNHLIEAPHPNISVAHECEPIPIEMIVRGYLTGVTKTSPWYSYQQGERVIYGVKFPNGLRKNDRLPTPIITPTTHGGVTGHDERLTREQIMQERIVSPAVYMQMEQAALGLFSIGTAVCAKKGLILVDTKYEFGFHNGLTLMDEVHTPDSSRFWDAESYAQRQYEGLEPINLDKELLRKWYAKQGFLGEGTPPQMTDEVRIAIATVYLSLFEKITGNPLENYSYPVLAAINEIAANL